jgi:hypothetical protein
MMQYKEACNKIMPQIRKAEWLSRWVIFAILRNTLGLDVCKRTQP